MNATSEQRKPEFILWHRDFPAGVRVFADQAINDGAGLQLLRSGRRVAVSTPLAMAVNPEALSPEPAPVSAPMQSPALCTVIGEPAKFVSGLSSGWPFLAGLAVGLLAGVLGMLIFAFV